MVTIGSPTLPGPSLRTWQSILSSLAMLPREKHAPKDYSVDRTKGSIISNLEKCAYLTPTRLSSSTSNRYAQPTTASGRWRKSRQTVSRRDTVRENKNGEILSQICYPPGC